MCATTFEANFDVCFSENMLAYIKSTLKTIL